MRISPSNPGHIFQPLFSLHHFHFSLHKLFPITHLLRLRHLNLFFISLLNKLINLWFLPSFRFLSHTKLILCSFFILFLLLLDLSFLWSCKDLLSFLGFSSCYEYFVFLLLFDQLGFIENLFHHFGFFIAFLFYFFLLQGSLSFKFLAFTFCSFLALFEELSLLLDCGLCLFFGGLNFSVFLLCFFKT